MKTTTSTIFISYSHSDLHYLNRLKRHLSIFQENIIFWDDSKILAGQIWRNEIENALKDAKIAILIISADFLSSKFISQVELPSILNSTSNGLTVLTLIAKPCLFSEYPTINKYQAVNAPNQALSKLSENDQEEIYVKLALRVKELLL